MISPWESVTQTCERFGIKPTERSLLVRISTQTMQYFRGNQLARSFAISTSKRPPSNVKGSLGTPRGLHQIAERIGSGQPTGMVFRGRVPLGRHFRELDEDPSESGNLVTTRILWLSGLEPTVNQGGEVDTYDRYVYIHGTNREAQIGQPQSGGCVLMRNLDIIDLYEEIRTGDQVLIVD